MNAFQAAAQVLFNDPNGSEEAILYLPSRKPLPVRVLRRGNSSESDVSGARTLSVGTTFEVLQAACPHELTDGCVLRVGPGGREAWTAFDIQADQRKGTWILSCQPA